MVYLFFFCYDLLFILKFKYKTDYLPKIEWIEQKYF